MKFLAMIFLCILLAIIPFLWGALTGSENKNVQPTFPVQSLATSTFQGSEDIPPVQIGVTTEADFDAMTTATMQSRYAEVTATTQRHILDATLTREGEIVATQTMQAWLDEVAQ